MIKASFAGKYYEKDYVSVMNQINSLYESKLGPGDLATSRKNDNLFGILVPHDKYSLSGACAAWAYKILAESKFPDTFLILVPDQTGTVVNYLTCLEDFETEFGVCRIDKEFAEKLLESGIVSKADAVVEQALEVQLPLLQHACKDRINDIKILPIVVPSANNVEILAKKIVEIKKDLVVIVVSNFTKYGNKFLFTPFKYNVKESLEGLDLGMIRLILNLDSEMFLKNVKRNKIQVSGSFSVALGLNVLKLLGAEEGELLSYYKSSSINKDEENSVSYFSFIF
ncbi:AmmeMemoRadiSam system protein B [archaeon]|jgi:AmmeMemoRadiSam system protein B|nr:AmmeMemoRadiSam system protein B [archaeon]MBT3730738.1 AmmeMemoRadiSam system protein B [archaeon]MBT4669640.1 AmmeMemoRadiSam system protein B [archaeon]MBT5030397.1 AmmeMemoRadiSam system protein B [archaeon]MBT5288310.1 AmmeMemoRadiSam system protein B [archaeon]